MQRGGEANGLLRRSTRVPAHAHDKVIGIRPVDCKAGVRVRVNNISAGGVVLVVVYGRTTDSIVSSQNKVVGSAFSYVCVDGFLQRAHELAIPTKATTREEKLTIVKYFKSRFVEIVLLTQSLKSRIE